MFVLIHSSTRPGTRAQQAPEIVARSDYKSMLVSRLCDEVEGCLGLGTKVYARVPNEGETRIEPPNNMYAVAAAVDRGCTGVTVEVPGSYREHFVLAEI